jgi:hypothetical protein
MTEQQRIDWETLLKRAVGLAGAAYVAPVLTSSAAAEANACAGQSCTPGKKGRKQCRRRGGRECNCIDGTCQPFRCPNARCTQRHGCTGPIQECGFGNCICECNGARQQKPGICIDYLDGLCDTFAEIGTCPGGQDSECPPGTACFVVGACADSGYPPLCGPCCTGNNATPASAA